MFKFIASLAIASVVAVPVAFAQPKHGDHHHGSDHRRPAPHRMVPSHGRHQHYRPGYKYRTAPHGWHRYSRRPGDWRTRGCIIVGPVWFCP